MSLDLIIIDPPEHFPDDILDGLYLDGVKVPTITRALECMGVSFNFYRNYNDHISPREARELAKTLWDASWVYNDPHVHTEVTLDMRCTFRELAVWWAAVADYDCYVRCEW